MTYVYLGNQLELQVKFLCQYFGRVQIIDCENMCRCLKYNAFSTSIILRKLSLASDKQTSRYTVGTFG